jgi:hypothetical protein
MVYLKDEVRQDFWKTGKCNLQIANGLFMTGVTTLALPKNSPYTISINRG